MSKFRTETLNRIKYNHWDVFVDQSPQGDVFCYTWWLESITKNNFKIIVALENEQIVAGMPLAFDDLNRINEPPLTRTLGILYKPQEDLSDYKQVSNQRKWSKALLEEITLKDFVQISTHHNFKDCLPFKWKGLNQTTKYTYLIHYKDKTVDDLYSSLNSNIRQTIKNAIKYGIRIEQTDDLKLLYKFVSLSFERQQIKFNIPYEDIKRLDDAIVKNGHRIIFKAIDNSHRVHALLYVAFNVKSAYQLLSGSDYKIRKFGGHTLVRWEAIRYFIDKVPYFNFGGSNIQHIEEHVRSYGGELTPYFHIYNEKLISTSTGFRYHLKEIFYHLEKLSQTLTVKNLKRFFVHKFRKPLLKYDIYQFDKFRKSYSSVTFKSRAKLANKWLIKYPEQAHFDYSPIEKWLKNIVEKPANILEIGGWRGDLAVKALAAFEHINTWHNYDLLDLNNYQKCTDERYRLITLDDYIWNKKLRFDYNALIATHMIEHICWNELVELIRWIPLNIRTVLFEAPIPASAENINWKGDYSSHVLEKGWEQVINEMKNNNFSVDFFEDNTYIFRR